MRRVYVGIDIGSKWCAAVAIDPRGRMVDSVTFRTSGRNLVAFLGKLKGHVSVLIEECELAGWVRDTIKPHVDSVEVSDPKRNAWVARGDNKSDGVDAGKLAELLRLGSFSPVWHTDDGKMADLKVVVQHYDETSRRLARLKCQLKARLRRQGVITTGQAVYGPGGRAKVLERVQSPLVRRSIEADYELLDFLSCAKQEARGQMVAASGTFPVIRRLREVPGVGDVLASRFVACVGDPHRFNRSALTNYSRLGVVKRSSDGSPIGREHLSRSGNPVLKDVSRKVFDRARTTRRPNGIKEYYERSLRMTGSETSARLNTQRKVLALMRAIWRDGTEYADDMVTGQKAFTGA